MPPSSHACLHRLRFSSRHSLFVATAEGGEGGLGLGGGGGVGGGGSVAGHCNNTSSYIQVRCTKLLQHSLFLLAFVLLNFVFFFRLLCLWFS